MLGDAGSPECASGVVDFAESVTLAAVSLAFAGNASVACSLKPLSSGFGVAASATVSLA
jgi:hypothetical protein